jgi:hypothetical protein
LQSPYSIRSPTFLAYRSNNNKGSSHGERIVNEVYGSGAGVQRAFVAQLYPEPSINWIRNKAEEKYAVDATVANPGAVVEELQVVSVLVIEPQFYANTLIQHLK